MEVEWGRQLYAKTLVDQVANACYKDRAQIEKMIRGQFEAFKTVPSRDFEYGFKIRVCDADPVACVFEFFFEFGVGLRRDGRLCDETLVWFACMRQPPLSASPILLHSALE